MYLKLKNEEIKILTLALENHKSCNCTCLLDYKNKDCKDCKFDDIIDSILNKLYIKQDV